MAKNIITTIHKGILVSEDFIEEAEFKATKVFIGVWLEYFQNTLILFQPRSFGKIYSRNGAEIKIKSRSTRIRALLSQSSTFKQT